MPNKTGYVIKCRNGRHLTKPLSWFYCDLIAKPYVFSLDEVKKLDWSKWLLQPHTFHVANVSDDGAIELTGETFDLDTMTPFLKEQPEFKPEEKLEERIGTAVDIHIETDALTGEECDILMSRVRVAVLAMDGIKDVFVGVGEEIY